MVVFSRFCGGHVLDIKRKLPFFASDFYDALHIQSLSAILFIYLGTVTNAITFGGLLGDATENMQVNLTFLLHHKGKLHTAVAYCRQNRCPVNLESALLPSRVVTAN